LIGIAMVATNDGVLAMVCGGVVLGERVRKREGEGERKRTQVALYNNSGGDSGLTFVFSGAGDPRTRKREKRMLEMRMKQITEEYCLQSK